MDNLSRVPPGFRFHPTDEELVDYYLRRKIASRKIDLDVIKVVDLYRIEPWDLQEICRIGTEERDEWYFFSHKDKKYPTGTRTNRATTAGFWKATGRDKAIYCKQDLIGMRKTLVFYKGRAPNGQKSDWIMHEYRLEIDENGTPQVQEEGWVVCRAFKKRITTVSKMREYEESPIWYHKDHVSFMPSDYLECPKHLNHPPSNNLGNYHNLPFYTCKRELDNNLHNSYQLVLPPEQLPLLVESNIASFVNNNQDFNTQLTDWRVLDKLVASQLSHEDDVSKEIISYSSIINAPPIIFQQGTSNANVTDVRHMES